MSAAGFTPIQLYRSTTASAVPTSGNLADGELAINTNDGKLYYKDSGGAVQLIASKAGASGDVVGPASATDNAVVRFDGTTGKLVQNSVVTIADSTGDIAGAGSITSTSASGILTRAAATQDGVELIGRAGGSSSYKVTLTPTTLGGNRTLTLPDTTGTVALTGSTVASFSAGSTGFTPNTATTGAVTLAGTLATTNGGTGLTSFTANGVVYASSSSVLATGSALTFDGTNFANTLSANSSAGIRVTNSNAGTSTSSNTAYSNGTNTHEFGILGTGYTTYGVLAAGDAYIYAGASKNISLSADGGAIKFGAGASGTEQMRLTSTGLGIGTSSPANPLNIVKDNTAFRGQLSLQTSTAANFAQMTFYDQTTLAAQIYQGYTGVSGVGNLNIANVGAAAIALWTANTERMRLDSSGNLGIGTSTPASVLNIKTSNGQLLVQNGTSSAQMRISAFNNAGNANAALIFEGYSSEYGRFDASGNLGIGTTTPISNGGYGGLSLNGTSGALFSMLTNGTESSRIVSIGDVTSIQCKATTGYITFVQGVSGGTTRMTLDSSGNLGLGVTPATGQIFELKGYGGARRPGATINDFCGWLLYDNTGATLYGAVQYSPGNNAVEFGSNQAIPATIYTNNTERARITSGGNLLVGETSDYLSTRLLVDSASTDNSTNILTLRDSGDTERFRVRSDGYTYAGFYPQTTGSAANVFIGAGGDLLRSTSSLKYKRDVQDAIHGLAEVMALRSVTYKGKSENDGDKIFGGLIAEEVHAAGLTEFVQYAEDGTPDALAYGNMVSLCIKAIQEQQTLIESLTSRVAQLEGA